MQVAAPGTIQGSAVDRVCRPVAQWQLSWLTEMAQACAQVYAPRPWTTILVSPLRQTIETAQPLCDQVGLKMQLRSEL